MPENIDTSLFTNLIYAFATVDGQFRVQPYEWNDVVDWNPSQGLYSRFNSIAHSAGVRTSIALGGWNFNYNDATKSIFTTMAASAANRAVFIRSAVSFARTHQFDGIDLDWEYPSNADQGGRPQDKANFVTLLREFRAAIEAEQRSGLP